MDSALSVVIVGAGVAGANAALELRRLAPDAHVTLIGSEPHLPYQRPPLSKGFLRGTEPFDAALVAPRSDYARLGSLNRNSSGFASKAMKSFLTTEF